MDAKEGEVQVCPGGPPDETREGGGRRKDEKKTRETSGDGDKRVNP